MKPMSNTDPTTWGLGDTITDGSGRHFFVLTTPPTGAGTFQIGDVEDGPDLLRSESARSLRVYKDGAAKWHKDATPFHLVKAAG